MNFFGHAVVAAGVSDAPRFVFGSMLPDWLAMIGGRARILDAELAAGVAFHHRCDALFHVDEEVVTRMRRARERLLALGLPRGAALGLSHVGVELAVDGALAADARARRSYAAALADEGALRAVELERTEYPLPGLLERLRRDSIPDCYRDPLELARRSLRALARRPRLDPGPGAEPRIGIWAAEIVEEIGSIVPALLDRISRAVVATADPSPSTGRSPAR